MNNEFPSKKLQELQDRNRELEESLDKEQKKASSLTGRYELLEEEHVLFKAQLTTDKEKLETEIKNLKVKVKEFDDIEVIHRREKADLMKKITDVQKKLTEAEFNSSKATSSTFELERSRLRAKLEEKESEFNKLSKQNEMNVDQLSSMRKEVSFFWEVGVTLSFILTFVTFRTKICEENSTILRESTGRSER